MSSERTWVKRIVFVATALAIVLVILGATTHRPVLLKRPEQIQPKFEESILQAASNVDREFQQAWEQQGLTPAPKAPWSVARGVPIAREDP
jgi:hypothetical protein